MPSPLESLEADVSKLKTYNQLGAPNATQQTAEIKLLTQCVARLIFLLTNHPDDTP